MRIGSLFSGIGGLELGLERALPNAQTVWQVELDPYCRKVLEKHWPHATRYEDIKEVGGGTLPHVDLVCGGFPCQDVSSAGARRGLAGQRSGLWFEYRRILEELRPRFAIVENVASGKKLWLPQVKADLASLGYATRAIALSAADVGAPHLRRRVFVVADLDGESQLARTLDAEVGRASETVADVDLLLLRDEPGGSGGTDGRGAAKPEHLGWRTPQPPMVRMVHGVSRKLDGRRRRALGNAVVPQCAEVIGRVIQELRFAAPKVT